MTFTLVLDGFKNNSGNAFVEILDETNKPVKQLVLPIVNQQVNATVTLPAEGKYGIRAFHDANNNKKLDTNAVGYPTEIWGASNNARPTFRAPRLSEMLIQITDNQTVTIHLH